MSDVIVLMYHHISPQPDLYTVTTDNFRSQLKEMTDRGYRFLTGSEFQDWREGRLQLEKKSLLLTFDDGWLDNRVHALPLLQEYQVPAVFFVVSGWPGEGPPRTVDTLSNWQGPTHATAMKSVAQESSRDNLVMRWSELLEAMQTGLVSLQSHSHSHGQWWQDNGDWQEVLHSVEQDLIRSRDVFRSRLGQNPDLLCWPRGQFTLDMVQRAQRAGFRHQFTTLRGGNLPVSRRLIRRLHVENRPGEWLTGRIRLYADRFAGTFLGLAHQQLYRKRMLKMWRDRIPRHELEWPYWRLI